MSSSYLRLRGQAILAMVVGFSLWAPALAAELRPGPSTPWLHFETTGFRLPDEAFPVDIVFVSAPVDGLSHTDIEHAITEATEAWNRVPCSSARLQWAGFRETLADVADDELPLYFTTGTGDFEDQIAWTVYPPDGEGVAGMSVRLNHPRYRWDRRPAPFEDPQLAPSPTVDLRAVITHELGHVLGLSHSNEHRAATMAATYLRDGSQSTLSADDKLGLCSLYPVEGSECTDDSHCPGAPCVTGPSGAVCDIPLGRVGDYCGYELQHCPDYCHIEEADIGVGYCSTDCAVDDDCPANFQCTRPLTFIRNVCVFSPVESIEATRRCSLVQTPRQLPPWQIVALLAALVVFRRRHKPQSRSPSKPAE